MEAFWELIKAIFIGIVQGITEWLPISSTGHMILADEFIKLNVSEAFRDMFFVVIQLGSILAVVVLYFHKLNPFSPSKTPRQRQMTVVMWLKVAVAAVPAALIGFLFDDDINYLFYNYLTVAVTLILYGAFFAAGTAQPGQSPRLGGHRPSELPHGTGDWALSNPGADSRHLPLRLHHFRGHVFGMLPQCGGGVFLFPGNPHDVRRQRLQAHQILCEKRSGF